MNKLKVVVVGNCQARPLATYLEMLNSDIEITAVLIVHLLKDDDLDQYDVLLESADIIISQLVFDTYHCNFVKTSYLKQKYGNKVTSVVNLFFSGYFPDFIYIREPSKGPLSGPLLDYHCKTILEGWYQGGSIDSAVFKLGSTEYFESNYSTSIVDSLLELKKREKLVDINICDFIEDNYKKSQLFFTMNHPCKKLLVEYSSRILTHLDLGASFSDALQKLSEPLDPIIIPPAPNVYSKSIERTYSGFEVCNLKSWYSEKGARRDYNTVDLVGAYYQLYDANKDILIPMIDQKPELLC